MHSFASTHKFLLFIENNVYNTNQSLFTYSFFTDTQQQGDLALLTLRALCLSLPIVLADQSSSHGIPISLYSHSTTTYRIAPDRRAKASDSIRLTLNKKEVGQAITTVSRAINVTIFMATKEESMLANCHGAAMEPTLQT